MNTGLHPRCRNRQGQLPQSMLQVELKAVVDREKIISLPFKIEVYFKIFKISS